MRLSKEELSRIHFKVEFVEERKVQVVYFEKEHIATKYADFNKGSRLFAYIHDCWKLW